MHAGSEDSAQQGDSLELSNAIQLILFYDLLPMAGALISDSRHD